MKYKITKKEIKNNYDTIISVGYCDAQSLLYNESPFAYSTRVEGWACDYYDIDGACISTGYAPIEGKSVIRDFMRLREYEEKARKIHYGDDEYEDRSMKIDALLKEFVSFYIK